MIDLTKVKDIVHNGKHVKKIEDKNGRILWEIKKNSATINITVGKSQDITTTQYYNRIVLPSLSSIKSAVASKIGMSSSNINVTKVELDCSKLHWYNDYFSSQTPYFSLSTSSPSYFGSGTTRSESGNYQWGSYELDVTNYLGKTLYGYRKTGSIYNTFSTSSSSGSRFCSSSSSYSKPTFTLVVTYEY